MTDSERLHDHFQALCEFVQSTIVTATIEDIQAAAQRDLAPLGYRTGPRQRGIAIGEYQVVRYDWQPVVLETSAGPVVKAVLEQSLTLSIVTHTNWPSSWGVSWEWGWQLLAPGAGAGTHDLDVLTREQICTLNDHLVLARKCAYDMSQLEDLTQASSQQWVMSTGAPRLKRWRQDKELRVAALTAVSTELGHPLKDKLSDLEAVRMAQTFFDSMLPSFAPLELLGPLNARGFSLENTYGNEIRPTFFSREAKLSMGGDIVVDGARWGGMAYWWTATWDDVRQQLTWQAHVHLGGLGLSIKRAWPIAIVHLSERDRTRQNQLSERWRQQRHVGAWGDAPAEVAEACLAASTP